MGNDQVGLRYALSDNSRQKKIQLTLSLLTIVDKCHNRVIINYGVMCYPFANWIVGGIMSGSRFSKLISVVITGVIAISGLPSMVLADMINAPTYYSVQSELDYEITTNITSSWSNHESIDLVLTNTGSDTIHNWYLTFNTPYNIENIWNSTINETDGNGTYTITSNGWNQDIHTGESVTIGITFSSDTETELSVDPTWYLLNTQATVVDASQYTLEYTEYSA